MTVGTVVMEILWLQFIAWCPKIKRSKGHLTLWVDGQESIKVRYHSAKFVGHRQSGNDGFRFSRDLASSRTQALWLWSPSRLITTTYHHWWSMFLVCHLTSQDYVIKRSCDLMGRSPLWQFTILQSLVSMATLVVES